MDHKKYQPTKQKHKQMTMFDNKDSRESRDIYK